jgi:hypothetical protein
VRRNTRRLARRFQDIVRPHFALCREVPLSKTRSIRLSQKARDCGSRLSRYTASKRIVGRYSAIMLYNHTIVKQSL